MNAHEYSLIYKKRPITYVFSNPDRRSLRQINQYNSYLFTDCSKKEKLTSVQGEVEAVWQIPKQSPHSNRQICPLPASDCRKHGYYCLLHFAGCHSFTSIFIPSRVDKCIEHWSASFCLESMIKLIKIFSYCREDTARWTNGYGDPTSFTGRSKGSRARLVSRNNRCIPTNR